MKLIIGNTGLIGKTILQQDNFDYLFNSKNIHEFEKVAKNGDEIFLCCLPASKWIVNSNLKEDVKNIYKLIDIISKFKYKKVTLISTIDVYSQTPLKSNEDVFPVFKSIEYGSNRYLFELLIKEFVNTDNLKIFRLPGVFNKHITKNTIFDIVNNKFEFIKPDNIYQWYNLDNLLNDINFFSKNYRNDITFNLFTEPIKTSEIIEFCNLKIEYKDAHNHNVVYDYYTKYNNSGYLYDKKCILLELKKLIYEISSK